MKRKFPVFLLAVCMILTAVAPVSANAIEENSLLDTVQNIFDSEGVKTEVTDVADAQCAELWNHISALPGVDEFLDKVENDGYSLAQEVATLRVNDSIGTNTMYFIAQSYENGTGDTVCVMYTYYPKTDSVPRIFAAKIEQSGAAAEYYEYEGHFIMTRDITGNDLSFFCSMSGYTVCTIWAAMFLALPVVSGLVDLGCSAAFAYACSYA